MIACSGVAEDDNLRSSATCRHASNSSTEDIMIKYCVYTQGVGMEELKGSLLNEQGIRQKKKRSDGCGFMLFLSQNLSSVAQ